VSLRAERSEAQQSVNKEHATRSLRAERSEAWQSVNKEHATSENENRNY
jgi:hypothetical protein